MNILDGLNDEQKLAVTTTEGYIRVIAGAGSGKTKALTSRYAYLVKELGISPNNILCVTFTNKAANEMKNRVAKLLGETTLKYISTFHGFCVKLLKEDYHFISYPQQFIILDKEDSESIMKTCFEKFGITSKELTKKQFEYYLAEQKNLTDYYKFLIDPEMTLLNEERKNAKSLLEKVFYEYLYEQRKMFGLDFNDLIIFALYILRNSQDIRNKWQQRFEYVMVDEYQDVNLSQYNLTIILSNFHKNLFVVGDPDQTIYSWRGAKVSFILKFDKQFPNTNTIVMDKNYRSLDKIIQASNSLIKRNQMRLDKNLEAMRKGNGQAVYFHAKTTYEEARWIAQQISSLKEQNVEYYNMAILYRAHYISREIEETLIQNKIPYVIYSGIAFYSRREIKDILSYLRLICHGDDLSFLRIINVPKRNIGKTRIEILRQCSEANQCSLYESLKQNISHPKFQNKKVEDFISLVEKYKVSYSTFLITDLLLKVLSESGYEEYLRLQNDEDRLDNLAELKQSIYNYENSAGENVTLEDYLDYIALYTNADNSDNKSKVKMMTVHTAKGLEFPYVFVVALNEGIFPSSKIKTKEELEEERRLAYVAYTRAEDKLFLSDAEGFNYDGSFRYPSRFIFNTERVNLDYLVELDADVIENTQHYVLENEDKLYNNYPHYLVGQKVNHEKFGDGEIIEINESNNNYTIKFDELNSTRSISFSIKLKLID